MNESLLRKVPFFSTLPENELDQLAEILRPLEISPGSVLCREGEPGEYFYVVLEGQLEILKAMGTPDERLLNLKGPGDYIGEMSLLEPGGLRTACVRAQTLVKLLAMTRAEFEALLQRRPKLALNMLRELSSRLRRSEMATIHDLQEKNLQLTRAYEELKAAQAQIIEKEKLERELQVAAKIQGSMLPQSLPQLVGFDFGARMVPARAVGGDLFDFIPFDADNLGIFIGDVSDKGVPAALFMALTRSLLRAEAARTKAPKKVLRQVNAHLLGMNESGLFVTAIYGVLNRKTREFVYARAGHELPLIFDKWGEMSSPPLGPGQMLGIFSDFYLDVGAVTLPPGSSLLLYTDGVTDASDPQGEFFAIGRLQSSAQENLHTPAQNICDRILQTIRNFQGSAAQFDDITLLAVRSLD